MVSVETNTFPPWPQLLQKSSDSFFMLENTFLRRTYHYILPILRQILHIVHIFVQQRHVNLLITDPVLNRKPSYTMRFIAR